jgi:phosphate transport system substrate-binding protein
MLRAMNMSTGSVLRRVLALVTVLLALSLFVSGCGRAVSGTITEAGSTTVQPLAERLADRYTQKHPDIHVIPGGGGTSVGITSVKNGLVDIGAASRELKADEPQLVKHLLARDGIAIVTSPDNPVDGLTKDEIRKIFGGITTNWKEVGGPDHAITVVVREEGSGTRTAFEELVMAKPEPAAQVTDRALQQNTNVGIRTYVAGSKHAIGFISFGYVDDTVKALAIDGVKATEGNAKNGTYPIVRPLHFLTKEAPTGLVKQFIDFCLSAEGQAIVAEEGYISIA